MKRQNSLQECFDFKCSHEMSKTQNCAFLILTSPKMSDLDYTRLVFVQSFTRKVFRHSFTEAVHFLKI